MNVMILLLVAGALALLAALAVASFATHRFARGTLLAGAGGGVALLYGAALLATSLASHERLLAVGATKRFCGFYLDCHLGVAVESVATVPAVDGVRAAGTFHVVRLRVSSNAKRATLRPGRLEVVLVDLGERRLRRSSAAEAALARTRGAATAGLERALPPGGSYTVDLVFDVPDGSVAPRLLVREGIGLDRLIESVLIGDEDAILHKPTLLALR